MARTRQLNVRLSAGEFACLEAIRGRNSQADELAALIIKECERRWHERGQACDEEGTAPFADALWLLDHERGKEYAGRPPSLPKRPRVPP